MGHVLQISGLVGDYLGILTMARYGLAMALPPLPKLYRALTAAEANEGDRRDLIGCSGVLLFSIGTIFQVFAALMGN